MVVGSASEVLWQVLASPWDELGFDSVADDAFKKVDTGGHVITAAPTITSAARRLLDQLPPIPAPGH